MTQTTAQKRAAQTEALAAALGMTAAQLVEDTKRQARKAKALATR